MVVFRHHSGSGFKEVLEVARYHILLFHYWIYLVIITVGVVCHFIIIMIDVIPEGLVRYFARNNLKREVLGLFLPQYLLHLEDLLGR